MNSFSTKLKTKAQKSLAPYLYKRAYTRAIFSVLGLAIQECKVSFSQFFTWRNPLFSFFRALKYFIHGLLRLLTGRSIRVSYGYKAEDRLIESLLKPIIIEKGFYVEVGCNEPLFASNTFLFYRRGWRGVCIDPNERLIKKHKRIRPQDQAVCALVSDVEEQVEYVELDNEGLSTADAKHLQNALASGQNIRSKRTIKSLTLNTIFDQLKVPNVIDFLSIDAEGNDLKVLLSLDFQKYQPKLIIVEADDFDPSNPNETPIRTELE